MTVKSHKQVINILTIMIVNVIRNCMLLCEVINYQMINLEHRMIIKNMFEAFKEKMDYNLSIVNLQWADIKI